MREEIVKVYKASELNEKARRKVVEKYWDINVDFAWYEFAIDDFKDKLRDEFGLSCVEIQFSGFCSQGDGASFTGQFSKEYIELIIKENNLNIDAETVEVSIRRIYGSRYVHEKSCYIDVEYLGGGDCTDIGKLENILEKKRLEYCKIIYKNLEEEHEYLTGEYIIVETLDTNDFEFLADGTTYKG